MTKTPDYQKKAMERYREKNKQYNRAIKKEWQVILDAKLNELRELAKKEKAKKQT
jgi:hypothetical protein